MKLERVFESEVEHAHYRDGMLEVDLVSGAHYVLDVASGKVVSVSGLPELPKHPPPSPRPHGPRKAVWRGQGGLRSRATVTGRWGGGGREVRIGVGILIGDGPHVWGGRPKATMRFCGFHIGTFRREIPHQVSSSFMTCSKQESIHLFSFDLMETFPQRNLISRDST